MPGRKGAQVVSETRYCVKCGKETEHRRYRIKPDYANGEPRYQWRCYEELKRSDLRSKSRRRSSIAPTNVVECGVINASKGVKCDRPAKVILPDGTPACGNHSRSVPDARTLPLAS